MSDNVFDGQSAAGVNLAGSGRTGIGRWLELVCDGDADAIATGLDAVGDVDEVEDIGELVEAIGFQHAVIADIKDDETLEYGLQQMTAQRGLEGFAGPDEPPAGAARCTALLQAFADWVAPRGYTAVAVDDGCNWGAALVQSAHRDELLALSGELGIDVPDPREAWAD